MEDETANEMRNVCNYLVAFIDLLGQSEKLEKYDIVPSTIDDDFYEYLRSTYGRVKLFQQGFYSYFDNDIEKKSIPMKMFNIKKPEVKIKASGDALIIYTSLVGDGNENNIESISIYSILVACALNFIVFLAKKRPFRGGIDIGIGIEDIDLGLYGSAISKAYYLESKCADFPRIVLGNTIMQYFSQNIHEDDGKHNVKENVNSHFCKMALRTIKKDENGFYFLDVLCDDFVDIVKTSGQIEIYKDAYNSIIGYIDSFADNKKLKDRYMKLKDYFDKRMVINN